eukprot:TRINITY_DN1953_c0_g1_i1.p1 TRINITY_DN1953_c0_g1~~TRINITY_DN1953_c0_g1_i1.p1  ORF type:complete len:509 (-),score=111.23 TRINITY_DN1953_c0_g1_i1:240-1766(-)
MERKNSPRLLATRGTTSSVDSDSSDSTNNDGLFQEFCVGNFENLKTLSDRISLDRRVELGNLLVDISEATYKNRELMEWVFDQRINRAETPFDLFKRGEASDSMEVIIRDGLRMRFGCIRWLSSLSTSTIQFLDDSTESVDSMAFKAAEDLLNRFVDSIYDIPIWLRQSCIHFKSVATLKLGVNPPNPLLCGFLSSNLHGAMEGDGSKYKEQLILIDSLINSVGGLDFKPLDEKAKRWVEGKKNDLKKFEEELLDAGSIALAESIVSSSQPQFHSLDVFLRSKERKFHRIVQYDQLDESSQISDGTQYNLEIESEKLSKKMDSDSWRYDKTWDYGITSYLMRSDESQFFALKIQFRIKAKLMEIAKFVSSNNRKPEYDPDITVANTKMVGDGNTLVWGYGAMKWPISDRYFAFHMHEVIDVSKNQVTYVVKNTSYPGGGKKNAVFAKVFLSGHRFIQDPTDPEYVLGTVLTHADPGGLFPVWLVNKNARRQCAKVPRLIKAFLKSQQS